MKISVIMSVYNESLDWIKESIDSILQQTFTDFEFIIINDNPKRFELIDFLNDKKNKDNRIFIINNKVNLGLTKSLNIGLEKARGEYIARMDADDISLPQRFEKQLEILDSMPEIGICGTGIKTFGHIEKVIMHPETTKEMCLFLDSPIAHPTVMFRKKILNSIGYDENFKVSQDYALWARLYKEGFQFYNVQEILLNYRYSDIQISSKRKLLQYNLSKKIRRDLLCFELSKYGYKMSDPITWSDLKVVKSVLPLTKKNYNKLIFYLYLSIKSPFFLYLGRLFFSGDIVTLPLVYSLRIIYYKIKGFNFSKY